MFRLPPHSFRGLARSTFATALAIFSFSLHVHAKCAGTDILPEFNRTYPEIMQQVRKDADNIANTEAIFWRVEKSGHKASHLFGTMHVTDKRIIDMPPEARNALRKASLVALEIANMSPTAMMQAAAKVPHLMVYADGSSLSKKLPAEEFDKVASLLGKAGVPKQMAAVMRPWMISTMLAVPLCEQQRSAGGEIALDLRIEQTAATNKIPVVGLETIEAQLKSMAGVADADQLAMLRASLAFADQREDLFETLIQAYLKRDLGVVLTLSKALSQIAGLKSSGFAGFSRALIKKRNQSMFDTSLPLVDKGNAFIAVGAAHLIGDNGLVALYRKAGFTVTAIN